MKIGLLESPNLPLSINELTLYFALIQCCTWTTVYNILQRFRPFYVAKN